MPETTTTNDTDRSTWGRLDVAHTELTDAADSLSFMARSLEKDGQRDAAGFASTLRETLERVKDNVEAAMNDVHE
jgi:hypothetical protein